MEHRTSSEISIVQFESSDNNERATDSVKWNPLHACDILVLR